MSEIDDAAEFAAAGDKYQENNSKIQPPVEQALSFGDAKETRKELTPGQVSQYSLYGPGLKSTTPTVDTLTPGIYDIRADNNCVFVVPMAKPTGILLELPEMRSEEVIKIVERFWASEKDYKEGNEFVVGGAAFKAGIMIYGPPGTGKSCTIKIVSQKLVDAGGTVFHSSGHPTIAINFLTDFSIIEKDRKCIVILEDIDSLIHNYGESTFLEMLDSAKTVNNVMFIATTNYPERLDPRIYNRPGRFSHVVKIGKPGPKAREAYLKAILKNHRDVEEIVKNTQEFTIDHLTALVNAVYREKKNLQDEIKRLRTLFKVPQSEEEKNMGIMGLQQSKDED